MLCGARSATTGGQHWSACGGNLIQHNVNRSKDLFCAACPLGGVCDGKELAAADGYWVQSPKGVLAHPCIFPKNCPGGAKPPPQTTVVQTVAFSGTSAGWTGNVVRLYEVGYAIALGLYDRAAKRFKAGVSCALSVASRRAVDVTFRTIITTRNPVYKHNITVSDLARGLTTASAVLKNNATVRAVESVLPQLSWTNASQAILTPTLILTLTQTRTLHKRIAGHRLQHR